MGARMTDLLIRFLRVSELRLCRVFVDSTQLMCAVIKSEQQLARRSDFICTARLNIAATVSGVRVSPI